MVFGQLAGGTQRRSGIVPANIQLAVGSDPDFAVRGGGYRVVVRDYQFRHSISDYVGHVANLFERILQYDESLSRETMVALSGHDYGEHAGCDLGEHRAGGNQAGPY